MKRVDQGSSAIMALVAVVYLYEATRLPLWKGTTFGSGLFPLILGIVLLLVSLASLLKATAAKAAGDGAVASILLPPRAGARNLAWVAGSLGLYILVIDTLGFVITTFLFLSGLFIALEPERKARSVALAGGVVALTYCFFVLVFKMQLPRGLLG